MKKTYIILLFVVLGVVTVNAQGIRYGVTGGINLHTTSGDVDTEGVLVGYYAGVKSIYDFLQNGQGLYLTGTLALSEKAFKTAPIELTPNRPETSTYGKVKTHSVEVPIRMGYKFPIGRTVKLLAEAGPYISIGLWGNYDVYTNGKKVAKYNEAFDKYGIRRCDFGLGMGLGLQYSEHYQLNISYNHGLAQLTHPEKKEKMFSTPSLYNRTFNITISYIF